MSEPACWELDWAEVAVLDGNAISLGVDEWTLMRAAGESLARKAQEMSGGDSILFLCGPGNNGGDGFVAASILATEEIDVTILASHTQSKSKTAKLAREKASETLDVEVWPSRTDGDWALVVDCLLGAGAAGPGSSLRRPIIEIARWADSLDLPVLACDIPTGLGSPDSLVAEATLTFHSLKKGMTAKECGEISITPLPWPSEVEDCGRGDIARYPPLNSLSRKGDRGKLWIIGGGPYHGAPILAGLAAARTGCDLVHVAMPSAATERTEWPPTLIHERLPDREMMTVESVTHISQIFDSKRLPNALVIGPGLGTDKVTIEATSALINLASDKSIPVVIDADGIYALPTGIWPRGLNGVATPHSSEAKRWLDGKTPHSVLSRESGEEATIVITGPVDELTGPEGRRCFARGGHPRMAVGGTGDLLAGTIGGLLAQGMQPWPAARLGCALLREAGNRAAEIMAPGLLAEDVPIHIAQTLSIWLGVK